MAENKGYNNITKNNQSNYEKIPGEPGWLTMIREAEERGDRLPGLKTDFDAIKKDISRIDSKINRLGKKHGDHSKKLSWLKKEKLEFQEELYCATVREKQLDEKLARNKIAYEIKTAGKTGYVQGVCECVAAIGEDHALGKKLLTEMKVTKDMARKFANPETFKTLEKGMFAPQPEQKQEHSRGRTK